MEFNSWVSIFICLFIYLFYLLINLLIIWLADDMFHDFLHLETSIKLILYQDRDTLEQLLISNDEWLLLEQYHQIFEIFRKPTKVLQGMPYFYLFIYLLINLLIYLLFTNCIFSVQIICDPSDGFALYLYMSKRIKTENRPWRKRGN